MSAKCPNRYGREAESLDAPDPRTIKSGETEGFFVGASDIFTIALTNLMSPPVLAFAMLSQVFFTHFACVAWVSDVGVFRDERFS